MTAAEDGANQNWADPRVLRVQALVEKGATRVPNLFVRPEQERPKKGPDGSALAIPELDLARLRDPLLRDAAVAEVGRVCQDWGFLQVLNHGVPLALLQQVRECGHHFFARPLEEKMAYACPAGVRADGYGSRHTECDNVVLSWRDYLGHYPLPLSRRNINNWPDKPTSYRQTIEEFSLHMKGLAQTLLAVMSEALGLCPSYLEDAIGDPCQAIVFNYYPPCPQPELVLGLEAHSDIGAMTILMQEDVAGLQVCKDGLWVTVQPCPGALVVNVGDQLEILSNGRFKSVEHRALVNCEKVRMSYATFYMPYDDRHIAPAPELLQKAGPVYHEVVFGEYMAAIVSNGLDGKKYIQTLSEQ